MLKKSLLLVLILVLALSLVACGAPEEEAPTSESLPGMTDEATVNYLLGKYKGLNFPAVSYEVSSLFHLEGLDIRTEAEVSVKGGDFAAFTETTVGDVAVNYNFRYVQGILYVEALGAKVKGPASAEEAQSALDRQLPFVAEDLGIFRRKDLLRSEDGSCLVVLSDPSVDVTSLLNLSAVASREEASQDASEEDTGIRFTKTKDFYLSLSFSSEGALQKMAVGGEVTVLDEGAESQMKMEVVYKILSTDAAQIAVTVPEDGDEYQAADSSEPESPSDNTDDSDEE